MRVVDTGQVNRLAPAFDGDGFVQRQGRRFDADASPFVDFDRSAWARLGENVPLPLAVSAASVTAPLPL